MVFGVPAEQIAALAVEIFKMMFIAVALAATAFIAVALAATAAMSDQDDGASPAAPVAILAMAIELALNADMAPVLPNNTPRAVEEAATAFMAVVEAATAAMSA